MENLIEKNENEMETRGISGFKELNLSYYIAGTLLIFKYTCYGDLI